MATDEEYLDSLLKSMADTEPQSRSMDDVMKTMNIEVEKSDEFSLSTDDLADMLDKIEETDVTKPIIEEIQDEVPDLHLDSLDMPVFPDMEEAASSNEMADDDFIRRIIAQQEALEAGNGVEETLADPVMEELMQEPVAEFEKVEPIEEMAAIDESVMMQTPSDNADVPQEAEEWKADLESLLKETAETTESNDDVDLMSLLTSGTQEWDEVASEQINESFENMDVTELIDNLEESPDDLLEINDLLKKVDSNEYVEIDNADMLALLGGMQEEEISEESIFWGNGDLQSSEAGIPEELLSGSEEQVDPDKKRKKKEGKKGLFGKKNKVSKSADISNDLTDAGVDGQVNANGTKAEKKPGKLAQFFTYLTQEEEDTARDQNAEILSQLELEDALKTKEKKKKSKKGKKKKEDNSEKSKEKAAAREAREEKKRLKKQQKEQKKQEKRANMPVEKPRKVLSKRGRLVLIAFCASLIAAVLALSAFLPDYVDKNNAREAFYVGDYETVYKLLYGKQLNDSDQLLFKRVETVLSIQRKLDAYENKKAMGKEHEALDALLQGIERYNDLEDAEAIGVQGEVDALYDQMCGILLNNYGLTAEEAMLIIGYGEVEYSRAVYDLAEGKGFNNSEGEPVQEENPIPQDILPEEEEIIGLEQ